MWLKLKLQTRSIGKVEADGYEDAGRCSGSRSRKKEPEKELAKDENAVAFGAEDSGMSQCNELGFTAVSLFPALLLRLSDSVSGPAKDTYIRCLRIR